MTAGFCRVLLVPGPFVFSLHAIEARSIVRQLNAAGCQVLELPSPTRRPPALRRPEGASADG
ncbi:hypothetical protein OG689_03200 [Kitasatospora sp. NBC_00240]|uniref:hypothetical protein n=1 Tax=Kitasatospora sp. NBC_00240 TaxID=2903567 RepID=UPI0022503E37|nr:hypothetical protein [Kitasatospora sp. NBC_00240]MCX5208317.1 hypothetical protein [Kitasatospora sp. NBC_00240]